MRRVRYDRDMLQAVGQALYGTRWQTDLSRCLGVNSRRVRQWMAGERPIPRGVWRQLLLVLMTRLEEMDELARTLADSLPVLEGDE